MRGSEIIALARNKKFYFEQKEVFVSKEQRGQGSVIFLHGFMGSKANWMSFAQTFRQRYKNDVYCVDAPLHGSLADLPVDEINYPMMSDYLVNFIKFKHIRTPVHLVGHSMGGKIAAYTSLVNPELVKTVSLIDITVNRTQETIVQNIERALNLLEEATEKFDDRKKIREFLRGQLSHPSWVDYLVSNLAHDSRGKYVWPFDLEKLKKSLDNIVDFPFADVENKHFSPAFLVTGAKSNYVKLPKDMLFSKQYFNDVFYSTQVPFSGHLVQVDNRDYLMEILRDFMKMFE